ncbi:alpha-(1-2)-phosphatidylinositol mannosyltransferase, partial [Streptomyces ardesiacus]
PAGRRGAPGRPAGVRPPRPGRRRPRERGSAHVRRFDWSTVGADILSVYETVTAGAAAVATDDRATGLRARFGLTRD